MIRSHACSTSAGRRGVAVGEDVGVAAHQLVDEQPGDGVDVEGLGAGLLGHPRVEDDLQQHVAELLGEVGPVAALDGVQRLVGLLDEVGRQALVGLLGVPGAATRRAQPVHGGDDVEQPAALHVPRPDDDLDVRGHLEARHLGRQRVGQPRVAVGRAQPHDRLGGGEVDEAAGQRRRGRVGDLLDGEAELVDRLRERLVEAAGEPHRRVGDGLPRAVREQAGRDAGRRDDQREPAVGHCAALSGLTQPGVVSSIDAVCGLNVP